MVASQCIFSQKRYMIAFLAFFGYMNMFCLRANLSMAIVQMTSNETILLENGTLIEVSRYKYRSMCLYYWIFRAFFEEGSDLNYGIKILPLALNVRKFWKLLVSLIQLVFQEKFSSKSFFLKDSLHFWLLPKLHLEQLLRPEFGKCFYQLKCSKSGYSLWLWKISNIAKK